MQNMSKTPANLAALLSEMVCEDLRALHLKYAHNGTAQMGLGMPMMAMRLMSLILILKKMMLPRKMPVVMLVRMQYLVDDNCVLPTTFH